MLNSTTTSLIYKNEKKLTRGVKSPLMYRVVRFFPSQKKIRFEVITMFILNVTEYNCSTSSALFQKRSQDTLTALELFKIVLAIPRFIHPLEPQHRCYYPYYKFI